jgi:hypothetical protein
MYLITRCSRAFQTSGPRVEDAETADNRPRASSQCDAYRPFDLRAALSSSKRLSSSGLHDLLLFFGMGFR